MSKYETKNLSGSLFKNDKKEKDNHPDYTGECLIDGKPFYMSAWLKTAESGRKWMSFSFKPKEDTRTHSERKQFSRDEDVPF